MGVAEPNTLTGPADDAIGEAEVLEPNPNPLNNDVADVADVDVVGAVVIAVDVLAPPNIFDGLGLGAAALENPPKILLPVEAVAVAPPNGEDDPNKLCPATKFII